MKYSVQINATLKETDPAYATIDKLGIEKSIEKFKKDLSSQGIESLEVFITEVKNDKTENNG